MMEKTLELKIHLGELNTDNLKVYLSEPYQNSNVLDRCVCVESHDGEYSCCTSIHSHGSVENAYLAAMAEMGEMFAEKMSKLRAELKKITESF